MAINSTVLALLASLRAAIDDRLDRDTRALTEAWAAAWAAVADELEAALLAAADARADGRIPPRSVLARDTRLRAALAQARARLDALAAHAGVVVTAGLPQIVQDAAAGYADLVAAQLPPAWPDQVTRPARAALDQIVRRSTQRIESQLRPLPAEQAARMRRSLVTGVAAGDNPRATARRMVGGARRDFTGGLSRALGIARTETLDAHRGAGHATTGANSDVVGGWVWVAHLGARTCPACLALHGTRHPTTEPGPLDHPNGRCTSAPVTKSWADLGFPGIPEPEPAVEDARDWFDRQPEQTQLRIMGPARLDALRSGAADWTDLAVRERNPGWRDAWQPRPVRELAR